MNDRTRTILIVSIAYVAVVVVMTLPTVCHLSQRLIGNNIDNWIFFWNDWWLERAVIEGRSPFFTQYMFYPGGTSLVTHANSFLSSALALPLRQVVGPVAAYNLVFLLGLWLASVGMYLLVHDMTQSNPAAFLAGFIFAFAPYHLTQRLGHTHLGAIQWWPYYALFLRRSLRERRLSTVLYAGGFLALTVWSGLHLALLLMLWTTAYAGWYLLRRIVSCPRKWRQLVPVAGRVALVVSVGALLSIPILYASASELGALVDAAAIHQSPFTSQTDVLAYFLPPTYHPLLGRLVNPFYEVFIANRAFMPYLGAAVLALVTAGAGLRRGESGFWLVSLACWIVLACGPALRMNGNVFRQVKLPYHYLSGVFPISALRSPDRLNLLVIFSVAVLAGLGAAHLALRMPRLTIALGMVVVFEYLCTPLPMWKLPPTSPFIERMAREAPTYAVVDYPMGYTVSKYWLYFQTLHGKPVVEGHVSRYTPDQYAFIAAQPLLRSLYQIAEPPPFLPSATFSVAAPSELALGPALRSLEATGVRYILAHKPNIDLSIDPRSQAHLHDVLPGVPTYEDSALAIYDVSNPLPIYYDGFPFRITSDVALVRFDALPEVGGAGWDLKMVAVLAEPRSSEVVCRLQLNGSSGPAVDVPVTFFEVTGDDVLHWQQGDMDVKTLRISGADTLQPDVYRWSLTCPSHTPYVAPETLAVAADGSMTYLRRSVDVSYGDVIQLTGYRWRTVAATLELTLRWRIVAPPHSDYKVFVHLLDEDGQLAQQYDAAPCNWGCPTGQWQPGDVVLDQASIPIWELTPGEYQIAVGLYDRFTLERLRARGPDGQAVPDDYLTLPDRFVISGGQQGE